MRKATPHLFRDEHQKNIVRSFDRLCYKQSRWTIWSDFVMLSAISISNAVDKANADHREEMYRNAEAKYDAQEREEFSKMLAETIMGIDENPDQDFLGELFMRLELSNDHNGQFFTPYNVCRMMAEMCGDVQDRIERDGWASINDPCCGAGALLLAFANACRRKEINYQQSVLFVAQDIDFIVGCMCYIQLSLLGCPGYVVIGDTIRHPSTTYDRRGLLPRQMENAWFTPMYFTDNWHWRRVWAQMDMLVLSGSAKIPEVAAVPEQPETEYRVTKKGQLAFF